MDSTTDSVESGVATPLTVIADFNLDDYDWTETIGQSFYTVEVRLSFIVFVSKNISFID